MNLVCRPLAAGDALRHANASVCVASQRQAGEIGQAPANRVDQRAVAKPILWNGKHLPLHTGKYRAA
ncbi:MAG TPA: hypothetical protein VJ809_04955, partial [Pirellulales bacterium]|nr:hypothetical protein [Pirellulales bacterium]